MNIASNDSPAWRDAVVSRAVNLSADTLLLRLESADGKRFPLHAPGAHVAFECGANGITRYYSLTGAPKSDGSYEIGVKRAGESTGGSKWVFENAKQGSRVRISEPRNHFALVDDAPAYLFVSGGIGVTPLLSMLFHLREKGVRARMVHMCRSREELAFGGWLSDLSDSHDIQLHFDQEVGAIYDIKAELDAAPPGAVVYCCGPEGLMKVVQQHGLDMHRQGQYHFEYFSSPTATVEPEANGEFTVVQASTGREIAVEKTKTMLAAIRECGIEMKSECEYGVCGWCAVPVLEGVPQHFDSYLTSAEREANKLILPCVSRCASARITLDI